MSETADHPDSCPSQCWRSWDGSPTSYLFTGGCAGRLRASAWPRFNSWPWWRYGYTLHAIRRRALHGAVGVLCWVRHSQNYREIRKHPGRDTDKKAACCDSSLQGYGTSVPVADIDVRQVTTRDGCQSRWASGWHRGCRGYRPPCSAAAALT